MRSHLLRRGHLPVVLALACALASCSGQIGNATTSIGRGVRKLSHREYNNVIRDLLGDTTQPANQFGIEVYVNGYDNGSDSLTVQRADVDALQAAAESVAARAVTNNLPLLIGSCNPQQNESACVEGFLSNFVKRAYRRPPSDGELSRLRTVYAAGAAVSGFSGGVKLMLEAILQSPAFLYREELGVKDGSLGPGLVRLTDYEAASELSFLITGSMPDDALFSAVENGKLKTSEDLKREALRLLASPAAQPGLRAFLHQWMATDRLASVSKDPGVYSSFTQSLATSMSGELDRYFDQLVGKGTLRDLFTSTQSFADANLAALYQLTVSGTDFQPVSLDARTRQGVLTRAGFLTAHADADSSGPVARGVFVLNALLCSPPPPPPPNIPSLPPVTVATQMHQTTRQRFDQHLTEDFCKSCHQQIDGVGFGFEQFDGLGIYRTIENGSPVDTSGQLIGTDVDGPFVGASELAGKLLSSKRMTACFVKQAYRFAMGQEETDTTKPLLASLGSGFGVDSQLNEVFVAMLADPSFVLRRTAQ